MNLLNVLKNGIIKGSVVSNSSVFQSQVGHGLMPRPLLNPVMVLRFKLFGAIQLNQEKALNAVKM
jgi:hypothetical protein